jgi:hypothetical protein
MKTKAIVTALVVLVVLGIGGYLYSSSYKPTLTMPEMATSTGGMNMDENGRQMPDESGEATTTKAEGIIFSGKLEKVNVGCFVDGECYVEVNGKHVTTTLGWRQEVVGSIKGVESFGDLEKHIGEDVEVYAHYKADGTYTLYGNVDFYVKLK